jgi:hypothetical protein
VCSPIIVHVYSVECNPIVQVYIAECNPSTGLQCIVQPYSRGLQCIAQPYNTSLQCSVLCSPMASHWNREEWRKKSSWFTGLGFQEISRKKSIQFSDWLFPQTFYVAIPFNPKLTQWTNCIYILYCTVYSIYVKGTVSRDFRPSVFFVKLYPWVPWFMG